MSILCGMRPMHVFQILYKSPENLDPGFDVLDNTANERPDWFEYWPIRKFLLNRTLDESAFYGFLSPRFKDKTNLSAADVREFVFAAHDATEVILFSPSIHNSAYFLSVFDHGEAEHPGLRDVAARVFERLGKPTDLDAFISDSRVTEALFEIAETEDDSLGAALRARTSYRGSNGVQMKIFIMERVATWLLVSDPSFASQAHDPFAARDRIYKLPVAVICDALKIAYVTQRRGQYKQVFLLVQGLRKFLNLQIRVGDGLGLRRVRPYLSHLKSYWHG
jgi:hypothetical protein